MDFRFRGEDGSCSGNHRNAGFDPLQTWDVQCNRVSGCMPADLCQSDRPAIRPCVGEPYATRSIEATRRAKSLPMTDFLHPWPPPSIRVPFAEVAHEAPYHQRGWQVARRNRARSRPFFCQESRYSYGPPCTLLLRDSSKKSVSHFGFGEIINDRCTNITTRTLSRYLKTESRGTIALRLRTHCRHGNRPSRDLCPQPAQADIGAIDGWSQFDPQPT
jgi:hypothetical protein